MSGSPILPNGLDPAANDQPRPGFGSMNQDAYGPAQRQHQAPPDSSTQSGRPFLSEEATQAPFSLFRLDMPAGQLFYQPQPYMMPQSYPASTAPFPVQGTPPLSTESAELKNQRKTKGHVASACVPCKKAHLRCDAQRPCSRCVSNGKEDSCIDVQHKKRGRPRLRDDRETRFDGVNSAYGGTPQSDNGLRRSGPFYPSRDIAATPVYGDSFQRGGSYRVLKSQTSSSTAASQIPAIPSYLEQPGSSNNVFGNANPHVVMPLQEPVIALMNQELRVIKSSLSFQEAVGIPSLLGRRLQEVVMASDFEKATHIQRYFENERRQLEPNYLPPIYIKPEDDKIIQTVGFGQEDLSRIHMNKQESLTFLGADNRQRTFHVRTGLARKENTYFIAITLLQTQQLQQQFIQPAQYPREQPFPYSQASACGQPMGASSFASPSQAYGQNYQTYSVSGGMPGQQNVQYMQNTGPAYSQQSPPYNQNLPSSQLYQSSSQSHSQPLSTSNLPQQLHRSHAQSQPQFQSMPIPNHPAQGSRQRDLQLPPIRDSSVDNAPDPRQREDRNGRLDIGGLIDKPDLGRR